MLFSFDFQIKSLDKCIIKRQTFKGFHYLIMLTTPNLPIVLFSSIRFLFAS